MFISNSHIGDAWRDLLVALYHEGRQVGPRGKGTREMLDVRLRLNDVRNNIILDPTRNLNYRFMVAEWLYIWFGHDDVETIARYNEQMRKFSDDGVTFNGAYGRAVQANWQYVEALIHNDRATRQAILNIHEHRRMKSSWDGDGRPLVSKDVPCTLSIQFFVRDEMLNTIVHMRSSDVWLGIPYDIFNFTMLANYMAARVEAEPGWLSLHLGSSHLYESNLEAAAQVIYENKTSTLRSPPLPSKIPWWLEEVLSTGKMDSSMNIPRPGLGRDHTPWFYYGACLTGARHQSLSMLQAMSQWP